MNDLTCNELKAANELLVKFSGLENASDLRFYESFDHLSFIIQKIYRLEDKLGIDATDIIDSWCILDIESCFLHCVSWVMDAQEAVKNI